MARRPVASLSLAAVATFAWTIDAGATSMHPGRTLAASEPLADVAFVEPHRLSAFSSADTDAQPSVHAEPRSEERALDPRGLDEPTEPDDSSDAAAPAETTKPTAPDSEDVAEPDVQTQPDIEPREPTPDPAPLPTLEPTSKPPPSPSAQTAPEAKQPAADDDPPRPLVTTHLEAAAATFALIQATRADAGVPALKRDGGADRIAQRWAEQMAADGHQRHNPDYATQLWDALGPGAVAENVGHIRPADATAMHARFVGSPGHYANIVGSYTHAGVGAAVDADGTLWVVHTFIELR